jgi:GAF domain-containing protein
MENLAKKDKKTDAEMEAKIDDPLGVRNTLLFIDTEIETHVAQYHSSRAGMDEYERDIYSRIEEIRQKHHENSLKIINLDFNSFESKKEIIQYALTITREKLRCQTAAIFLLSPKNGCLERVGIQGKNRREIEVAGNWFEAETYYVGESFTGASVSPSPGSSYGKTKVSSDFSSDGNLKYKDEYEEEFGVLKWAISIPLNGRSRSYGVLRVINKIDDDLTPCGDFSDGDLAWMAFLAGATAAAMSNIYRDTRSNVLRYLRESLISSNLDGFDYSNFYKEILGFLTSSETAFKAALLHVYDSAEMKVRAFQTSSDGNITQREDNNARILGQGFVGLAVKSAEPQIIEKITKNGLGEKFINSKWVKENNFESFGCFPIIIPGKEGVTVTLSLFADYEYEFHTTSVEFLTEVVSSVALVVQQEKRIEKAESLKEPVKKEITASEQSQDNTQECHMTNLLEQAIARVNTLSSIEQDSIAALIIEELEEDSRWDESFSRSPDLLAQLAAEAMKEHRAGKTQKLDPETL